MRARLKFCWIAFAFSAALIALFRLCPPAADWYARAVFPKISYFVRGVTGRTPWPIAEILVIMGAVLLVWRALRALMLTVIRRNAVRLRRFFLNVLCGVAVLMVAYSSAWAPLYARSYAIEPVRGLDGTALYALSEHLIGEANQLRATLDEDGHGLAMAPFSTRVLLEEARVLTAHVTGQALSMLKPLRYPEFLDAVGISGVYFPFTFETLINLNDLATALPFTACHEAAHQAGYAREEEASYIGWLACMEGGTFFRYSGTLSVLNEALSMLREVDRQAWIKVCQRMEEGLTRDYVASNRGADTPRTTLWVAQSGVADVFLRLNGQSGGLSSYQAVVGLVYAHLAEAGTFNAGAVEI